ncbi:hypothetical protein SBA2_460020 [Acidobacteriia bacterium SbA2]|nr:hypothetical protein SBA2_460020 [Acidobacteriia bacterium SbA2]
MNSIILSPSLVILSGAKNLALPLRVNSARHLALSIFKALRDSSSPSASPKFTSFPRKRESIVLIMGPRLRGDDTDFHCLGLAAGP